MSSQGLVCWTSFLNTHASPEFFRVKCLQKWKLKLGFEATYGLLLDVFLRTENDKCADKIVELLRGDPGK